MSGEPNMNDSDTHEEEVSYKGTFILVMLLGVFIVASWGYVFYIFMNR